MLESVFTAFMITIIIAFIIENLKISFKLKRVYEINLFIEETVKRFFSGKNKFDIFSINDLRRVLDDKLLKPKIIDKYELYRVNDITIKIIYNLGFIFQELEITSKNGLIMLNEKKINHQNN